MAPKNNRRGRRVDEDSDDESASLKALRTDEAELQSQPQVQKKTSKKKQKKKGAKNLGDWTDEEVAAEPKALSGDEGDTQQVSDDDNSSAQIPIQAKQKGKKKGKAAKQANFAALSALDDDPELDAENDQIEEADVPANGGVELNTGFAALNIEDSKDEVQSPVTEGRGSSAFAALDQEGSDQEVSREASTTATLSVEDEEGDPLSAQQLQNGHKKGKGKLKGRSKRTFDADAAAKPTLQVALVTSVESHPNADKLKVCQINTGIANFQVVTNAASIQEGMKVAYAPIGSTTPGSSIKVEQAVLRGVESFGMLCSAFDLGWEDIPDGVLVELPDTVEAGQGLTTSPVEGAKFGPQAAQSTKTTKSKKKAKKDIGFADLPEETEEADLLIESVDVGKKKSKKKNLPSHEEEATSLAQAALGNDDSQAVAVDRKNDEDGSVLSSEPGGDKKKKKKKADFDIDAVLAEAVGDIKVDSSESLANGTIDEPLEPGKKKKGKKKAAFDVDAVLAEAIGSADSAPAPEGNTLPPAVNGNLEQDNGVLDVPVTDAAVGKDEDKKGKKKKGKGADGEEDLDALLAEFGVDTEAATDSKRSKKKKKGKGDALQEESAGGVEPPDKVEAGPSSTAEAAPDVPVEAEEEDAAETEADGKELTAAQKKKLKKKAKDKAKKADGDEGGKKGPVKKESAAVRKLREEMERQKAAEEAAQRAEEERIRKEEEAARLAEEEAKRKEEEKQRRKEEKAKNRAELKRQGLLLTGKEKQEAERLAQMREQFLKNNPGLEFPSGGGGQAGFKKRPIYGKKKSTQKKQGNEVDASEQDTEAAKKAEEAAEAAKEAERQRVLREEETEEKRREAEEQERKAAEAARAAEEAEESDDVGWDDMDVDDIKLPGQESPEPEEEEQQEIEVEKPLEEEVSEVHTTANSKTKAKELEDPHAKKAKTEVEKPSTPSLEEAVVKPSQESANNSDDESEEESESEDESSEEESSSEEEDDSSEYTSSDESMDSEEAREERLRAAREVRAKRMAEARKGGSAEDLRSPICCILGHVDTGKTKLLDNIRRTSVQEGEAGGITQQIGATYVPGEAIKTRTEPVRKGREFGLKLPGLLIIDTPGHESFTNLRSRGSSLCDIAILVVDIMHGLEPQTIESINLIKQKKTPFIVALNKVDRLFEWSSEPNTAIRDALERQQPHVRTEFESNLKRAILNLNEQGLNVALYWENKDPRRFVNIVPTSAITGEGIPDMLQLVVQLTQKMMAEKLMFISELQCTILEVKVIEGLGTTIDVVLVNGVLHEGDQIVLCGLQGPIVTSIRSLLTPHPLKELRVRGSYLHHKEIRAAQGIKISAQNLESAVAGTQMLVVQKGDSIEDLKAEVMGDMTDIFKSVDKTGEGVCVQASTLGSLEALLEFLRSDAVRIPVSGINIGPVHKKDVMRASTMLEKGRKKFAVILAFDVLVTKEAQEQAQSTGVRIFTADIIYHLFDQFSAYLKHTKEEEQQAASADAVFPVELKIMPTCIFNTKDPIILGCTVEAGIAKVGTPLCVPARGGIMLGRIASMEINHKAVEKAKKGDDIALKIEATNAEESAKLYGRHFDFKDLLVSKISRRSIDLLKAHFKDQLERPDWQLVVKLKKVFGID